MCTRALFGVVVYGNIKILNQGKIIFMKNRSTRFIAFLSYLSLLLGMLIIQAHAGPLCVPGQVVKFSNAGNVVVVEYTVKEQLLANPDPIPFLRIYGDGLVKVHYPAYMLKAGDYEYKMTKQELKELIRNMDENCIVGFDKETVKQKVKEEAIRIQSEAVVGEQILHYRSDASISEIKVHLEDYVSDNSVIEDSVLKRTARKKSELLNTHAEFENIDFVAQQYLNVEEVQGFAAAVMVLKDIANNPKLKKVSQ